MQPINKINSPVERSTAAVLAAAYHKYPLTCKFMTSQVVYARLGGKRYKDTFPVTISNKFDLVCLSLRYTN